MSVALGDPRHGILRPDVWCALQERQRATLRLFAKLGWHDLGARRAVEVGCGAGGNLLELLRFGFMPEHLAGVELLPERLAHARGVLPAAVRLVAGDAVAAAIEPGSQDLVLQFTVFSSLLDDATQARLAAAMWRWVKPGGGVLWYDFTMDNPRNPDVRGMPALQSARAVPPSCRASPSRDAGAAACARCHAGASGALRLVQCLAHAANARPLLACEALIA